MNLLNVGCGPYYADGWVNTDVFSNEYVRPDVVVDQGGKLPFDDDYFDAVYMGHVLEHMPWESVHNFLLEINRVVKPGYPVLVVGPDIFRILVKWRDGQVNWLAVVESIEHADWVADVDTPGLRPPSPNAGPAAPHYWNSHEERVMSSMLRVFDDCASYTNTIELNTMSAWEDSLTGMVWPVALFDELQFALIGFGR